MKLRKTLALGLAALTLTSFAAGCGNSSTNIESTTETVSESATSAAQGSTGEVNVINDYNNTEELSKQFPVIYETPIETEMEKNIQNRLLTGFANWNQGFDTWKSWGDILYTQDSMYNLYGVRMNLEEYQTSQMMGLQAADIQMGDFQNMIICGDWTAIRYDFTTTNRETGETKDGDVMEFVNFADMGDDLGTRVVEGWASTKGEQTEGIKYFVSEEGLEELSEYEQSIIDTKIPDTDNLAEKYPVKHETEDKSEIADEIRTAILEDFDAWNQGIDSWSAYVDANYEGGFEFHEHGQDYTLAEYKEKMSQEASENNITRVYFENMLISGDWGAIRYQTVVEDPATGDKTTQDRMQFIHFAQTEDGVKIVETWSR